MTYNGKDRREHDRREQPEPSPVSIEGWKNGAARDIRTAIRIGKAIMGVVVLFIFGAGGWVVRQEMNDDRQDTNIGVNGEANHVVSKALADAVSEINETMAAVVAEQKAMRRDFEREHGQ